MVDAAYWRERLLDHPDAPDWSPLERALVEALLARPGVALPLHILTDAMWGSLGMTPPETVDIAIRVYVRRVRIRLADMDLNPDALVNDPPYAYGLNLAVLDTPSVRRPRYLLPTLTM